ARVSPLGCLKSVRTRPDPRPAAANRRRQWRLSARFADAPTSPAHPPYLTVGCAPKQKDVDVKLGEAFRWMEDHRDGQLVVTPAGSGTREWYRVTEDRDNTFYLNASMGMVSSFAYGLTQAIPEATVWAIAGDGGLAMNPSALATEAEYLPNIRHIII